MLNLASGCVKNGRAHQNDRRSLPLHPAMFRRQLLHGNDPFNARNQDRSTQRGNVERVYRVAQAGRASVLAVVRENHGCHRKRAQDKEMEPGEEGGFHSRRHDLAAGTRQTQDSPSFETPASGGLLRMRESPGFLVLRSASSRVSKDGDAVRWTVSQTDTKVTAQLASVRPSADPAHRPALRCRIRSDGPG